MKRWVPSSVLPLGPGEAGLGGRGEMEGLPTPPRLCPGLASWLELD